jgi:hypothetical protein
MKNKHGFGLITGFIEFFDTARDYNLQFTFTSTEVSSQDRLCGLVVGVPGYRSWGPGSIPGATRFSEM